MSTISDTTVQLPAMEKARRLLVDRRPANFARSVSMVCAAILLAILLSAIFAPWLGLADPYQGVDDPPPARGRHTELSAGHR